MLGLYPFERIRILRVMWLGLHLFGLVIFLDVLKDVSQKTVAHFNVINLFCFEVGEEF